MYTIEMIHYDDNHVNYKVLVILYRCFVKTLYKYFSEF